MIAEALSIEAVVERPEAPCERVIAEKRKAA
jgi:hypothetical protein